MIRLFFLVPIAMCVIWWFYLDAKGYTLRQGLRGYAYILAFNGIILLFFTLMIFVTH